MKCSAKFWDHISLTGNDGNRPRAQPRCAALVSGASSRRRTETVFTPAGGDLIIMKGCCRRDWQHCVPKQKALAGARMSLNFSSVTQS
jgi:hypothetical protein